MPLIRQPAVAGMFYPADAEALHREVQRYLHLVRERRPAPKALIVPHAGYIYSGPVAASAYVTLEPLRPLVRRVVLLGPSHRVPLYGLATSGADAFATPLGDIPLDREGIASLTDLPQVTQLEPAHSLEHSLEVQLPFLQECLTDFTLIPLVVGDAPPDAVGEVLERLWGGDETLIVISSDLSHYHSYDRAQRLDTATSDAITHLKLEAISDEAACGRHAIKGLLWVARRLGLKCELLDLRNSGDTAGSLDKVVGYGAYLLH